LKHGSNFKSEILSFLEHCRKGEQRNICDGRDGNRLPRFDKKNDAALVVRRSTTHALSHTHLALDNAIEQGALFCNPLNAHRKNVS